MRPLRLTKHHGLGNDFLVMIDVEASARLDADLARHLCDRRRGVGADGVIAVRHLDGEVPTMELRNADGGLAEMSGNGIRCLAQALELAGEVRDGAVEIDTAAGRKRVSVVEPTGAEGVGHYRVAMGVPRVQARGEGTAEVDMGNPHLVLLDTGQDLASLGALHPGVNIELVTVVDRSTVEMRVWERGVGATLACGTGSCAVAAATSAWGLTGTTVTVVNPGGPVEVELAEGDAMLTGPAQYVAEVLVAWP